MTLALDRFCINRKIAPNLDLDGFPLVKRCGLQQVSCATTAQRQGD